MHILLHIFSELLVAQQDLFADVSADHYDLQCDAIIAMFYSFNRGRDTIELSVFHVYMFFHVISYRSVIWCIDLFDSMAMIWSVSCKHLKYDMELWMQGLYRAKKRYLVSGIYSYPFFILPRPRDYNRFCTKYNICLAIFHCTVGRSVQHRVWRLEKNLHADLGMAASSATPSMAIAPLSAVEVSVRTA